MKLFRSILLVCAAAALIISCNSRKDAARSPEAAFTTYISAFTGGIVTDDSSIRIDLTQSVPESDRITSGLFSFSPSLKGTVLWTSPNSVSFIPDHGALKAGKTYRAAFHLDKLMEVSDKALKTFRFGFIAREGSSREASGIQMEEETEGFRVVSSVHSPEGSPYIELNFSSAPVNIDRKGMVVMEGVSRFYVEPQGEKVLIHYEGAGSEIKLIVYQGVKDEAGEKLAKDYMKVFSTDDIKPAVEIAMNGNILPDDGSLVLPFRAVNLSAVEVRIIKVYANNVLMFLQDNDLGETSSLRRAGRLIYHGDIPLDRSKDLHKLNNFSIDLSNMLHREPGAIYRIRLSFRLDQSLYGGVEPGPAMMSASFGKPDASEEAEWDQASTWYWDNDYDWYDYNYYESDDPLKASYYMESSRFPSIQLLTSDIGLVAKYGGTDKLWVGASDLKTARPLSSVQLEVYDFQLQRIAQARTRGDGMTEITVPRRPFVVVGTKGESVTYLKVNDGNEKSLSRFDVGGEVLSEGLKAYIYGERGVWRPGDTLHLTMVLNSKGVALPASHPATIEVYTPEGQFHTRLVRQGTNGFYSFDVPTRDSDPTGFWNAYVKVGGSSFHKTLNIETIKPNRLKIDADYGDGPLVAGTLKNLSLSSSWLTGSPASGLRARAVMTLRRSNSTFPGFENYRFTAPGTEFSSSEIDLFNTVLDDRGKAGLSLRMPAAENAPGMLNAFIVTSVMEEGGDESFTTTSLPFSPYSAYVGIRVPDGDYLETDKPQEISFAVVDPSGKRVSGHKLEYRIFKTGWNWWWESGDGDIDSYVSGSSVEKVAEGSLTSQNSDVHCSFQVNYPDWGNYLVVVKDLASGHVSGRSFTVDWPDYRGRAGRGDPENLTMLTFSTDKRSYEVGEKATLYIPAAPGGQALVSFENSTRVLSSEWVSTSESYRAYSFTVTEDMAPDFYIHLTLLKGSGSVEGDVPVRLYGVQRVLVENPKSHLEPQITMPDTLYPEEEFTIKINEKSGRPMTYTLAIVDEGLLDLTAFKTPDPWAAMNAVEALGVRTWDMYDHVIGAVTGRFTPLAAIGGDQDNVVSARKDNRFNPVVFFLPPQTIGKGGKATHKIKLPMYVGSVRVMVVSGGENAFGSAEKTVPVTAPLMVVPTLPRVMSPGEEIQLPVNVFAMEDNVRNADVSVKVDGPVSIVGESKSSVRFEQKGDKLVRFALKAEGEGVATIEVTASGAGHNASETVSLPVVNPNPDRTITSRFEIPSGKTVSHNAQGVRSYVQLASFPAPDVARLYNEMKNYPYSCSEQLASRGLAILHLLPMMDKSEKEGSDKLLEGIIRQLYSRQNSDGGFSYWGNSASDSWVSSMAGLFLVQASNAGMQVDGAVVNAWKKYQQKLSNAYRIAGSSAFSQLDEAYRLYTLAAAGSPSTAAMNRLREDDSMGYRAGWMLASAYAICGKAQVGKDIIATLGRDFDEYSPYNQTYGSSMRDRMVAMEALTLTGDLGEAVAIANEAVKARYLSTQETAFMAVAFDALQSRIGSGSIDVTLGGENVKSSSASISATVEGETSLTNNSEGTVFANFVDVVRDPAGTIVPAASNGLEIIVRYLDSQGRQIPVNSLRQGDVFSAIAQVTNTSRLNGYDNLALSMRIPSGWEIQNERLTSGAEASDGYDHTDIRDDRCDWFFSLPAESKKTFTLKLRAAYEGKFILPSVSCSAMYQPEISACTASSTVEVVR